MELRFHTYIIPGYSREEMEMPSVWSQICVQNMATLAKEATTVRRVLEPMLRYFDVGKQWSLDRGLSLVVLQDMQFLMEKAGLKLPKDLNLPVFCLASRPLQLLLALYHFRF